MQQFVTSYFNPVRSADLQRRFARYSPGAAFAYSNMGATLVATALEARLRQPYDRLSTERILRPLGMTSSGWQIDAAQAERNAILYGIPNKKQALGQPLSYYSLATYADGGLRSSCRDLARYLTELLRAAAGESTLLSRRSVQLVLEPQFPVDSRPAALPPNETNQGLFWQHRRSGEVGHSGGDPGLTAVIALDLQKSRGRIFLTNAAIEERPQARAAFTSIWRLLTPP